ncbi:MAG: MerR family transcriptional regulator [Actinomycetales bacterium]|nr:MerR family transcriptional regulator [Actinomycetales bacterium]
MNHSKSDWSIQELVASTGQSSRTLRHYDAIGLLRPSRIGANGMRYYDQSSVLRLQRILVLKELGLGLAEIAAVVEKRVETEPALLGHIQQLKKQRDRIDRQIDSLELTLINLKEGANIMPNEAFDGFAYDEYAAEAQERWPGQYAESQQRLARLSASEQKALFERGDSITSALAEAMAVGEAAGGERIQSLIAEHYQWTCAFWTPNREAYIGLGAMYVADERFKAHYEKFAAGLAEFMREAMTSYANAHLA